MKTGWFLLLVLVAAAVGGQDQATSSGPALFGDGGGRIWKWSGGKKAFLTPASLNLTLGGVSKSSLWGWGTEPSSDRVRFFSMALPKKDAKHGNPLWGHELYPIPDIADLIGDRLLLVYGSQTGARWEVWQGGVKIAARAYDTAIVYAAALGPKDGWIVAGRTADGAPWVNVSGTDYAAPEGWRGRLTVAAWLKSDQTPATPMAVGWGAPGSETPQMLFWEPSGWTQPVPPEEPGAADGKNGDRAQMENVSPAVRTAVYPEIGVVGEKGLALTGWQDTGKETKLWFWDGKAEVPGATSDGTIQALSLAKNKTVVVKHRVPPWFTLEDGKTSTSLDGLDENDRVLAVDAGETK